MDHSELDSRYFISARIYNCPFCKRNNVRYVPIGIEVFDWTESKECKILLVRCTSCDKRSMHLSFDADLQINRQQYRPQKLGLSSDERNISDLTIDELFFYHVPTSFFAVDERIPRVLRELITEAEGCLKNNFLTGASACVRKVIYELAVLEDAEGDNYRDRIKSLKAKENHDVDDVYFDTLLSIQKATSSKVHEQAFDGWESKHLRVLLSALLEVLEQMYVFPKVKEERRQQIVEMTQDLIPERVDDPAPTQLPAKAEQSE